MTTEDIIKYIAKTPYNSNPNVLRSMLAETVPDLSGVTAGAAQILKGYKGVDKDGKEIDGSYEPPAEKYEVIKFFDTVTIGDNQSTSPYITDLGNGFILNDEDVELIYKGIIYTFEGSAGSWKYNTTDTIYYDNSSSQYKWSSTSLVSAGDIDNKEALCLRQYSATPPDTPEE